MGWLELLPLIRRLLPLLDRLPPLLEGLLAGRAGAKVGEQFDAHITELTQAHTGLQATLQGQGAALQVVAQEIAELNGSVSALHVEVASLDRKLTAVVSMIRSLAIAILISVVFSLILLTVLLLRHA